jgi:hypothetical protein
LNVERKYAITRVFRLSVTTQVGLDPVQSDPPQPANADNCSGIAVNVIVVPDESPVEQVALQLISPLGVVTMPLPGPPKNTATVKVGSPQPLNTGAKQRNARKTRPCRRMCFSSQ